MMIAMCRGNASLTPRDSRRAPAGCDFECDIALNQRSRVARMMASM
jgi:hypothetical protein